MHYAIVDDLMQQRAAAALAAQPPLAVPQPKLTSEYFPTLVRSIVSQQISTKAAAAIFERLQRTVTLEPHTMHACDPHILRSCGLTKQKSTYVLALAQSWESLEVASFTSLPDAEIVRRLTAVKGIGVWTVQMFLLFALARPDVFAVGDLGLRQAVARWYELDTADQAGIEHVALQWAPHRSLASLTLWFHVDNGPVLL